MTDHNPKAKPIIPEKPRLCFQKTSSYSGQSEIGASMLHGMVTCPMLINGNPVQTPAVTNSATARRPAGNLLRDRVESVNTTSSQTSSASAQMDCGCMLDAKHLVVEKHA